MRLLISKVLNECKIERGYTYKFISEETGLPPTTVRYALNGGDNVGINVFEKLIKFFDLEVQLVVKNDDCFFL